MRALASAALCIGAASCSGEAPPADEAAEIAPADAGASPAPQPSPPGELTARDSRRCGAVAEFYLEAIEAGDFDRAAKVWDTPAIDAARLRALFADYDRPRFARGGVIEEGAAGSLYCTVTAGLTDETNPDEPASEGELVLRRVNDVPGATPEQLRWTIRSSTFVEPVDGAEGSEP